jgi:hypothetical protein
MNNLPRNIIQNETREEKLYIMGKPNVPHEIEPHGSGPRHLIPSHERKSMIYVEFDKDCEEELFKIFGSEEEAEIAINILHCAPPEQQVIALQILRMNGVNVKARFPVAHPVSVRWASPILGENVCESYTDAYGEDGIHYVEVLESAPYEISVISRMIAYMQEKRGE